MAIIDRREVTRFPVPHEPGEWIELRRLSGAELRRLALRTDTPSEPWERGLVQQIVAWSYAPPVSPDAIEALDVQTLAWLMELARRHNTGELSDAEKKDATSRLSDSSTAPAGSMPTSSTVGQ